MQPILPIADPLNLPWQEPLDVLTAIPENETYWAFLYSGMKTDFTGRYSFLGLKLKDQIQGPHFFPLEHALTSSHKHPLLDRWFGYFSYGLKNLLENLPEDPPSFLHFPNLWFIRYQIVLVWDHVEQSLTAYFHEKHDIELITSLFNTRYTLSSPPAMAATLLSNMTTAEYKEKVMRIKEAIEAGTLYQANLTRKFYGTLKEEGKPVPLFLHLTKISPSPYSALLRFGTRYILSSSPEQFLTISKEGEVSTRPIKGSAARFKENEEDEASKLALQQSSKNRAENLMIVDLMRNDLSRGSIIGSVKVKSLFDITTYATIHHLSSLITSHKRADISPLTFIENCFPPGSMTGAPKIQAMKLCSELEREARGVYSGALGWMGNDGSADLSVVIRTLLLEDHKFEFQVGGAIVADSTPDEEWEETLTKASAIATVLGITEEQLRAL